jgi:6-phosphogluconolactonase (cycloisomerase 2 family)
LGGTKVGGAANPSTVGGLTNWTKYYFTLAAVNGSSEVVAIADVAGTPVNQILQLSNANSDKIEGWLVNPYTGATNLSKLNSVGAGPATMVADNNLLYCTNLNNPVWAGTNVFTIDATGGLGNYQLFVDNGQLTEGLVLAKPATGKRFLYFSFPNAGVGVTNLVGYELDAITGKMGGSRVATVTIGSGYGYVRQLAVNPAGTLLFVSCMQNSTYILVYTINTTTGALTLVGPIASAGLNRPFKMQVDPSGQFLYVAHYGAGNLVAIKLADRSLIGVYATGVYTNCVAIDPSGKYLYTGSGAGTGSNGQVSAFAINGTTGALTSIDSYDSGGWYPAALSVDLSGSFLAVSNSQNNKLSIFNITPATGALTLKTTVAAGNGAGDMLFVKLP